MTQSVAMYSQNASSAPDWMGELSKRITLNGYAQAGYAYQDQPNAETSDFNLKRTLLWAKADINYHISHQADLQLSDPTGDYACNVLLPDMEYYRANYWQGRLEVAYQLPVVIKKVRTLWFAKLYGSYLRTNNSLNGRCAGLSIGMYF